MTQERELPELPEIGHPESYYAERVHEADRLGNTHLREAHKVGQYTTRARLKPPTISPTNEAIGGDVLTTTVPSRGSSNARTAACSVNETPPSSRSAILCLPNEPNGRRRIRTPSDSLRDGYCTVGSS